MARPSAAARPASRCSRPACGQQLSRDALGQRLAKHAAAAARALPLDRQAKRVTPHVLRHTAAMRLVKAGIDTIVSALWLGHERVEPTQVYVHADLPSRTGAHRTAPVNGRPGRYRPPDSLLAFLEAL